MDEYFDFQARPRSAWLTVNRGCNFRCRWCYGQVSGFNPQDEMTLDVAKNLALIGKNAGANVITIIGGEPTIWRPLDEFITFCKSNAISVGLVTNAYRFSNDDFWNKYRQNPCDSIGISVKSGNRNEFLKVTGVDLYENTLIGIQRAMELHNAGFSTVYNEMVGKRGLLEIARQCKKLGASSMILSLCSAILDETGVVDSYSVETKKLTEELVEIYPILDELFEGKIDMELFLPLCLFPKDFVETLYEKGQLCSVCHVHDRTGIVFDTNGDVLPCNTMIGNHIAQYGTDFFDGESLLNFLNSPKLVDDYRLLLRYPSEECTSCKFNHRCKGGCILNWTIFDPSICRAIK